MAAMGASCPELSAHLRLVDSQSAALRELASGVDALYLSGRTVLPREFTTRLASVRELAELAGQPIPFPLGELSFRLAPHGWGRYRFVLVHELGRIGFSESDHVPPIRIQPKAELLHAVGPEATVAAFRSVLESQCGEVSFAVSRVDPFADFQGWALCAEDRNRFLCRATNCTTFEEGAGFRGFQFGWRTTKTFSARVYDKTSDVERHGSDWWFGLWGDAYVAASPVHRVEFEIGRKRLTDFGLDTPDDVLRAKGDLWRYATEEWLTFRTPSGDSTRARWPIAPEWQQVQRSSLGNRAIGLERVSTGRMVGSLRRLMPPLVGYLAAFAAIVGAEEIDDTLGALDHHLRSDEVVRHRSFRDRIMERRARSGAP
jgi:hypothetical protein